MKLSNKDILDLDRITRLKLINSITGIKPANLIGTIHDDGTTNLAIFSSVVHLGSHPPLLGFIARPSSKSSGHTLKNITANGFYTINHVLSDFKKKAHYTSAKFERTISEFDSCSLTEEYIDDFKAPFVKESTVKIGLQLKEVIPISINNTSLVIGEIELLITPDSIIQNGDVDLEKLGSIGVSGLNSYYNLRKIARYPYVRIDEVSNFNL
ncbi:MAG: flavin reductase [Flavobacteriaceae bacterium]|nr:flavin reductase [Flavobacteriaceae bacterium]